MIDREDVVVVLIKNSLWIQPIATENLTFKKMIRRVMSGTGRKRNHSDVSWCESASLRSPEKLENIICCRRLRIIFLLQSTTHCKHVPLRSTLSSVFSKNQNVKPTLRTNYGRKKHQTIDLLPTTRTHHFQERGGTSYTQPDSWGAQCSWRCWSCLSSTCWPQKVAV